MTESADAAMAEYRRCQVAGTLLCFRAANVAVLLESGFDHSAVTRLKHALRAMRTD